MTHQKQPVRIIYARNVSVECDSVSKRLSVCLSVCTFRRLTFVVVIVFVRSSVGRANCRLRPLCFLLERKIVSDNLVT